MTALDYLTHLNLTLLVLIEQYCLHTEWDADNQADVLLVLIKHMDKNSDYSQFKKPPSLVRVFKKLAKIQVGYEGQSVCDILLARFEELENLDRVYEFFQNLELLFRMPDMDSTGQDQPQDIITLDEDGLLGYFVRRCNIAFQKCEFHQAAKIYESFNYIYEAWSRADTDMLKILDDKDANMLYNVKQYVQMQINVFESECHMMHPQHMQERIQQMIQQQPDHSKLHYLSFLNFAQSGEWEQAEKCLRHYFDAYQIFGFGENNNNVGHYVLLNLAVLNMRFGLYSEARKILDEATEIARDHHDNIGLLYLESWVKKLNVEESINSKSFKDKKDIFKEFSLLSSKAAKENSPRIQAHAELQLAKLVLLNGGNPRDCFESITKATILCYNFDLKMQADIHMAASNAWRVYGCPLLSLLHIQIAKSFFSKLVSISDKPQLYIQKAQALCDMGFYDSALNTLELTVRPTKERRVPLNLHVMAKYKDIIHELKGQIVISRFEKVNDMGCRNWDSDAQKILEEVYSQYQNSTSIKGHILESRALLGLGYTGEALKGLLDVEPQIHRASPVNRIEWLLGLHDIYRAMENDIDAQKLVIMAAKQAKENYQYGLWKKAVYRWKALIDSELTGRGDVYFGQITEGLLTKAHLISSD